jgi:hypothetical protein
MGRIFGQAENCVREQLPFPELPFPHPGLCSAGFRFCYGEVCDRSARPRLTLPYHILAELQNSLDFDLLLSRKYAYHNVVTARLALPLGMTFRHPARAVRDIIRELGYSASKTLSGDERKVSGRVVFSAQGN